MKIHSGGKAKFTVSLISGTWTLKSLLLTFQSKDKTTHTSPRWESPTGPLVSGLTITTFTPGKIWESKGNTKTKWNLVTPRKCSQPPPPTPPLERWASAQRQELTEVMLPGPFSVETRDIIRFTLKNEPGNQPVYLLFKGMRNCGPEP